MAVHAPSTQFSPAAIRRVLPAMSRLEIEQAIEAAIALLDRLDGDCDLEDDELHEDPIDAMGEAPGYAETALVYGIDQSQGPIRY